MSTRLPLQSKAFKPIFGNKRAVFGSDDEDDEVKHKDELVLGFEDNKVKEAEPKKEVAPLSISPLPNADWRANARKKKELYVPARAQQQTIDSAPEVLTQTTTSFGLQIQKRTVENGERIDTKVFTEEKIEQIPEDTPKTLEERAVEAIIKESMGFDDEDKDSGPKKVISFDESLSFRDDVESRPEETTMDDYEKLPVDEFGAALLRGLGWSEGDGIGRNRKNVPAPPLAPVKQREALLGLGAKPEEVDKSKKNQHKRAAYEYKDTSLFKKISKRKYEEAKDEDRGSRDSRTSSRRDDGRRSSSSHRHSSNSRRRDDDDDNKRSSSRNSSRDSRSSSTSSRRSRYDDDEDHIRKRRSRSPERHSSGSRSHSRRNSRSRSPSSSSRRR